MADSRLVEFIDFDVDNTPAQVREVREATRRNEVRLILSYHNLSYTPGHDDLVDPSSTASSRPSGWAPTSRWCR